MEIGSSGCAAVPGDDVPTGGEKKMSITETDIAELDCVELLVPIREYPIGTKGVAHYESGGYWAVEINGYDEGGMTEDFVDAKPEQLRVTWKWPGPSAA
jgi:hypothetical protein